MDIGQKGLRCHENSFQISPNFCPQTWWLWFSAEHMLMRSAEQVGQSMAGRPWVGALLLLFWTFSALGVLNLVVRALHHLKQ